jgi:glycosyltransferase involved in cell wall biosynthesis
MIRDSWAQSAASTAPVSIGVARGDLVSVVMPAFNRAHLVRASADSVLEQTHRDLELVIVDDASTDDTWRVISDLAASDSRVVPIRHVMNRGAQSARNTAIRASRGTWLAFLDADDEYVPDSIERRLALAEREGAPVVHAEGLFITEDGVQPRFGVPAWHGRIYRDVLSRPGPFALLFRRDLLDTVGGELDESIVAYQEWDLAIMLARVAPFAFMEQPVFIYNGLAPDAISRDPLRGARGYEQVVHKHLREIIRECGPRVLGDHYRTLADLRILAGDRWGAVRCAAVSALWWPPNVAWGLRRALGLTRRRRASG